jgi:hypothetical protein
MRRRDPRVPLVALAPLLGLLGIALFTWAVSARAESALAESALARPVHASGTVAPLAAPTDDGPAATLVGFRKTGENSALVYVQLTGSTSVVSHEDGNTLTFTLKGIGVPKANNRNPLVATHFHSIVDSARLVPVKNDTNLVIVLRREARASAQVVKVGDGAVLEVHLTAEPKAAAKPPAKPAP